MNEIQINWKKLAKAIQFNPTSKQEHILAHLNDQNTIVGGKRVGKTYLAAFIGLTELLKVKRTIWVVAPTYELAKRIWDPVFMWRNKYLDKILKPNIQQFEMRNMMTGSVMKFKSADNPVQLKGEGLDLVIGDEVGDWRDNIWHEYIAPNVAQLRPSGDYGKAFLIGNANYFGSAWHKLITDKGHNKFSFHLPTAYQAGNGWQSNNPEIITDEKLKELYDATPEKEWRQNYLAEFVPGQGIVFSNIIECARGMFEDAKPGRFYYIGIDIGRLQDFTVITVVDSKTFNVVYWERFKDIEYPFQKKRILEVIKRFGVENTKAVVDQTGLGQPIVDDLSREGINIEGYTLTNQSKKDIIEKLSILMQQRKIVYPEIAELIQELQVFSYKVSDASNKVQYNAPPGYHDDCVISLALAVFLLQGDPQNTEAKPESPQEAIHRGAVSHFNKLISKEERKQVSIRVNV